MQNQAYVSLLKWNFFDYMSIIDVIANSVRIIRCNDKDVEKFDKICTNGHYDTVINYFVVRNIVICVSNDYILALYDGGHSPMMLEKMILEPAEFQSTIRFFDWNCNFISSFVLREPITIIAYNETTKKLYGLDVDYTLYQNDISKIP